MISKEKCSSNKIRYEKYNAHWLITSSGGINTKEGGDSHSEINNLTITGGA